MVHIFKTVNSVGYLQGIHEGVGVNNNDAMVLKEMGRVQGRK